MFDIFLFRIYLIQDNIHIRFMTSRKGNNFIIVSHFLQKTERIRSQSDVSIHIRAVF